MNKYALIIHGWPQPVTDRHPLIPVLKEKGYQIISPNMFVLKSINLEETTQLLKESIKGKDIKLVIGISMGGLILPHLLTYFPNAKLIFIASGTKFDPELKFAKLLIRSNLINIVPDPSLFIKFIPKFALNFIWSIVSPFKGNLIERKEYEDDRDENFKIMSNLTSKKCKEIYDMVRSIDTSRLLKNVRNSALIVSGKYDTLMPYRLAKDLHLILKNSKIIGSNNEGHFGVLNKETLIKIACFI